MPNEEAFSEQLLTVKDVAQLLKVSVPTIYRLIKNDGFPPPLKVGHSSRWSREVVIKYLMQAHSESFRVKTPAVRPRRKGVSQPRRNRK